MPVILELGKQRYEDQDFKNKYKYSDFQTILVYIRPSLTAAPNFKPPHQHEHCKAL